MPKECSLSGDRDISPRVMSRNVDARAGHFGHVDEIKSQIKHFTFVISGIREDTLIPRGLMNVHVCE